MSLPRELLHTVEQLAKTEQSLVRDPSTHSQEAFTHVVIKNKREDQFLYLLTASRRLLNLYPSYEADASAGH
jgi:hypothetical protein